MGNSDHFFVDPAQRIRHELRVASATLRFVTRQIHGDGLVATPPKFRDEPIPYPGLLRRPVDEAETGQVERPLGEASATTGSDALLLHPRNLALLLGLELHASDEASDLPNHQRSAR
jgi:hypothetical protein